MKQGTDTTWIELHRTFIEHYKSTMKKPKKYKPQYRVCYTHKLDKRWVWEILIWTTPAFMADTKLSSDIFGYATADECETAMLKALKALGLNKSMKRMKKV